MIQVFKLYIYIYIQEAEEDRKTIIKHKDQVNKRSDKSLHKFVLLIIYK